jgi:hypothetical protein
MMTIIMSSFGPMGGMPGFPPMGMPGMGMPGMGMPGMPDMSAMASGGMGGGDGTPYGDGGPRGMCILEDLRYGHGAHVGGF